MWLDLDEAREAAIAAVERAEHARRYPETLKPTPRGQQFIQWCLNEEARKALGEYRMALDLARGV